MRRHRIYISSQSTLNQAAVSKSRDERTVLVYRQVDYYDIPDTHPLLFRRLNVVVYA